MKKFLFFLVFFNLFFASFVKSETTSILSEKDKELYKEIFLLQRDSNFYKADLKIKKLKNDILLGSIYAERYLHKNYYSKASELNAWLRKNRHHVDALRIYNLSVKKKGNPPIRKPVKVTEKPGGGACHVTDNRDPIDLVYKRRFYHKSKEARKKADTLMNRIYRALKRGKTLTARNYVESDEAKKLFNSIDYDSARTALAFAYYIDSQDDLAISYSKKAIERSGNKIPLSYWVYGLSNFRKQKYEESYFAFKEIVESKTLYKGLISAGAFFASRSAIKIRRYDEVNDFLKISAKNPLSFYGVIAKRALGHEKEVDFYNDAENVSSEEEVMGIDVPEAMEVLALLEISEDDMAYRQFKHLYYYGSEEMRELLIMFANENKQTGMLERITLERGRLSTDENGKTYYPVPKWQPYTGWQVDRAIVYAFMRQESCFNQKAKSKAGARGLMQIMPGTAALLARDMKIKNWSRSRLFDPEENITLGQKYIEKLLNSPQIDGNLFFTAIAYNAGPGNLIKWVKRNNYNEDPLLFIESIPSKETRDFVKKVIGNFWVYRSLINKHNPSLDDVVSGTWPIYTELDKEEELEEI